MVAMSSHAVSLDEKRFRAAEERARALGTTTEEYVGRLIELDLRAEEPFDQLLRPVREGFQHLDDDEIDKLFTDARKRARDASDE